VEMLQLAVAGHKAFRVEEIEKNRPGPSYTADTLDSLRRLYPTHEWLVMIGSDSLDDLPNWHEPERIFNRAGLLVAVRPEHPAPSPETLQATFSRRNLPVPKVHFVHMPLIDIASSDLRSRAEAGHSLRYLVARSVECYIAAKALYQSHGASAKQNVGPQTD
jgi:nicotinate-nucleotide adenylyltransferase